MAHLNEMFNGDSEHQIDMEELSEGENATHFIHAVANVVPNMVYSRLTGDRKNNLEFNHMANQLVFQYSSFTKEEAQ